MRKFLLELQNDYLAEIESRETESSNESCEDWAELFHFFLREVCEGSGMKVCARSLIETLSPSQEAYEIFVQKCYWEHAGSLIAVGSSSN